MTKPLALLAACALLYGCGGSGASDDPTTADAELLYNPLIGALPSPNDLAFQGSEDGTINATLGDRKTDAGLSVNSLDGFSTIAPSTATFTKPIDRASVTPGSSVVLINLTVLGGGTGDQAAAGTDPSAPGDQYVASVSEADQNGTTLAVTPLEPLESGHTYLVVVTNDVQEAGGDAFAASDLYQLAKSTDPLFDGSSSTVPSLLTNEQAEAMEKVREQVDSNHRPGWQSAGISGDNVIGSWTFTTQSIGDVIDEVDVLASSASVTAAFAPTGSPTPGGEADVWAGRLSGLPYYLATPSSSDPDAPTTEFWQAQNEVAGERNLTASNPVPQERTTVDIPVLLTVPKAGCNPCDVVVFQHGIGQNRKSALGIADALAAAGFATIAIDLPLHGLTDTSDPLYAGDENGTGLAQVYGGDIERTFELDLDGDNAIDPSGEYFVNLESLRTSRDNLRQSVADLLALADNIGTVSATVNAVTQSDPDLDTVSFNTGTIDYVGWSLGGIVGVPFIEQASSKVGDAVLAFPGGGIVKVLDGSPNPSISGDLESGLAERGLVKGLSGYEQFLGAAQTVIDSGDPLNYARTATNSNDVLMLEIVGGTSSLPDQVVPNRVVSSYPGIPDGTIPSPTAGTEPLALEMGLQSADASTPQSNAIVRFTAGDHATIVSPEADATAYSEMQGLVGAFLQNGTTSFPDGSTTVQPVSP